MRAILAEGDLDPETAEVVEGDVRVVEEQAAKPQLKGAIIVAKLEGITKLLTAAGGTAVAAERLLPYAQKALVWPGSCFAENLLPPIHSAPRRTTASQPQRFNVRCLAAR